MNNFPILLIILDGWGLSPSWGGNALTMNNPKNIDQLWRGFPHKVLQAFSVIADSPKVVADSQLGHSMIAAGRPLVQEVERIDQEIENRRFYSNQILKGAINWAKLNNKNLHLIGMISDGGIHSHINHLLALLEIAKLERFNRVYIHAITDGTDSGPTDALKFIEIIRNKIRELKVGSFASISGRYYAMDRDLHWDRTIKVYDALVRKIAPIAHNPEEIISKSYRNGLNDEYIQPHLIMQPDGKVVSIKSGDSVIFFNFRFERSRQLSRLILDPNFRKGFWKTELLNKIYFSTFTNYGRDLKTYIAFPRPALTGTLPEALSKNGYRQIRIAETEKAAHVTNFFNCDREDPFPGEFRKIVPSPKTDYYEKTPEMSASKISNEVIKAIHSKKYQFILVNYANVDLLAHTGNIIATGKAVQILDNEIGRVVKENLERGGSTIITADHGNAEQMVSYQKGNRLSSEKETLHSLNPVPFIYVSKTNAKNYLQSAISLDSNALSKIISSDFTLADIAPSILEIIQLPKPIEMTGKSILNYLE